MMRIVVYLHSEASEDRERMTALSSAGWRVVEAVTSDEAVHSAVSESADVVVLPLEFGALSGSGIDACRRLLAAAGTSRHPAVLLTGPAHDNQGWRAEAFAAGATACLSDPVDSHLLLAQLDALMVMRRAQLRSEERLQRQHQFLRTVIDSLSSIVLVRDDEGHYILANEACARFHGMSVADIEGRTIGKLDLTPPGSLEQDLSVMRSGSEKTLEFDAVAADGLLHSFIVEKTPLWNDEGVSDRVLTTAVDITWRRRAERALKEMNARAERMFSSNVVGMLICDFDGRIFEANDYCLQLLGLDRRQLQSGRVRWDEITPPEHAGADAKAIAELRERGVCTPYEKEYLRPDGSRVWVMLADTLLPERQQILAFVLDITERKRAEARLQQLNDQLAEADRRKDEFIAILSHELRNPVAPIRYALPLLQREGLTPSGRKAVAVIERQLAHLTRLVDDLLDVSRITRDKIELRREQVDLASVLSSAVEAATPAIAASRHTLSVSLPEQPIWMFADAARIAQAVTNLLNNSAKYTPRGGTIAVSATCEDGEAVIRVRDNGMGIPEAALRSVFDMFRQVNRPERSQGGLGIGLALVKRLAEMHGGRIEAHSPGVGHGAEFVLRLPALASRTVEGKRQPASRETWSGGRRLRVLVVDDNADLVEMLSLAVEGAGHEVRTALDGGTAVAAALAYRPDVVLLDLGLPVMTGLEVAQELRRRPELSGLRIVALTGWGQAEDRRRTQEAGFDYHLTKPTDPRMVEDLLEQFASHLN